MWRVRSTTSKFSETPLAICHSKWYFSPIKLYNLRNVFFVWTSWLGNYCFSLRVLLNDLNIISGLRIPWHFLITKTRSLHADIEERNMPRANFSHLGQKNAVRFFRVEFELRIQNNCRVLSLTCHSFIDHDAKTKKCAVGFFQTNPSFKRGERRGGEWRKKRENFNEWH